MIDCVTVPEGESGPWRVERFTIPQEPTMAMVRMLIAGRGTPPGTYTRLTHKGRGVVMSDTDAEKRDHWPFVRAATGHVLINGLGIGMCLNAALKKPEVTKVTVIELDVDVIKLVADHYAVDPRVEIINANAFEYRYPRGTRYGAVWHDIWDDICTDNLAEMKKLHSKYRRAAEWQGSWSRDLVEAIARQGKRRGYHAY